MHMPVTPQFPAPDLFELWLVEGDEFPMAVDLAQRVDAAALAERRRDHAHQGNGDLVEVALFEPGELQHPQRFVVERDSSRRHEDVGRLVDHQRLDAVAPEQVGDRRAAGSVADDENVNLGGNVGLLAYGRSF